MHAAEAGRGVVVFPLGHVETKWPARSSGIRTHIASVVAGDAVHYTRLTRRGIEVKLSNKSSRDETIHATWHARGAWPLRGILKAFGLFKGLWP